MSLRVAVLISGSGSNLQALLDACGQGEKSGNVNARIVGVLSNRAEAFGLERAKRAGVPTAIVANADFASRAEFDAAMTPIIDAWQPDVVLLAGFMRILTPEFVQHYQDRLLNIHPSLLPAHKGLDTHARAIAAGDSYHGCSVHYVSAELDGGPVVAQARLRIQSGDTAESLAQRVHALEHRLYPQVLSWLAEGRLSCQANQPVFDQQPVSAPQLLT